MKRIHLDQFSDQIHACLEQMQINLFNGNHDQSLLDWNYSQFMKNIQTEIWENSESLDGLKLQYCFLVAYYYFDLSKEIRKLRGAIFEYRQYQKTNNLNNNTLDLYLEEIRFLSQIDYDMKYLISELKSVLWVLPKYRETIKNNKMLSTLETLFKFEEDYSLIMNYLMDKGKINKNHEWIDRENAHKKEIANLFSKLYYNKFLRIEHYNLDFIKDVIQNTFNIEVSTSTIEKVKSLSENDYFPDMPKWEICKKKNPQTPQSKK